MGKIIEWTEHQNIYVLGGALPLPGCVIGKGGCLYFCVCKMRIFLSVMPDINHLNNMQLPILRSTVRLLTLTRTLSTPASQERL